MQLLQSYEKNSKQISSESTKHNNFLGAGIALNLKLVSGPIPSSFNPYPSLPSVVTDDRKQFERLNIVIHNKTGPFCLEFN